MKLIGHPLTVHTPNGPETWEVTDYQNGALSAANPDRPSDPEMLFDALSGECDEDTTLAAELTPELTAALTRHLEAL